MTDSPFDFSALLRPFLPGEGEALAVAVSGGPDSMALCHALSQVATGAVHAVTVDHGLRPEAAEEARQVGSRVESWPHVHHEILTRPRPGADSRRVQEAARHDRYDLLAGYCAKEGIERLFTAHHQDDQAETFLFRLSKGSGLDGLGAIRPVHRYSDDLLVMRPLLDVPKALLAEYCRLHDIPFVADPSNENDQFARVRLRGAYVILAAEGLTAKRLAVTAGRLARAREALEIIAENLAAAALVESKSSRIVYRLEAIASQPEELRLRVVASAVGRIGGKRNYPPRLERLEELVLQMFGDAAFKRASLAGCLISIDRQKGLIVIETEANAPRSV